MDRAQALALLKRFIEEKLDYDIEPEIIPFLEIADLPVNTNLDVILDENHLALVRFINNNGTAYITIEMQIMEDSWIKPLSWRQYADLVRRYLEVRTKIANDVKITKFYIYEPERIAVLQYQITNGFSRLDAGLYFAQWLIKESQRVAENVSNEFGRIINETTKSISGWDTKSNNEIISTIMRSSDSNEKGRALEELTVRLFSTISGFVVSQRIRTETEEIDVWLINETTETRLHKEKIFILVECKNWASKCGKDEFVVFHQKLINRRNRCSLGFLISWNGFTETVRKEQLRGSNEEVMVVLLSGEDLLAGVESGNFLQVLVKAYDKTILL